MKKVILILIILLLLGVAGFAGYKVLFIEKDYQEAIQSYDTISKEIVTEETIQILSVDPVILPGSNTNVKNLDWDKLKGINNDIVGYLLQKGTLIDYPVVQGKDNDYYLDYTVDKKKVSSGSIFADYRSKPAFDRPLTIIYGHNMTNNTMFGSIEDYIENAAYLDENGYMLLYTPDKVYLVEIFAYGRPSAFDAKIYDTTEWLTSDDYVERLRDCDFIKKEINLTSDEKFILMSTCTHFNGEIRNVIIGRLIEL